MTEQLGLILIAVMIGLCVVGAYPLAKLTVHFINRREELRGTKAQG